MPAENSTRETQPPETRGRRGWIDVSAARPVSTSQQTGDGDMKPHQPSDEASEQGTEAQFYATMRQNTQPKLDSLRYFSPAV